MDSNKQNLAVPIAIVVAGALIATAFLFGNNGDSNTTAQDSVDNQPAEQQVGSTDDVNPVNRG